MDIKEQLKDIKTQLRLSMNGAVSQSMREKGLVYKLNFGVELPRIKMIAEGYEKNHDLAQALWKEEIRECKILAGMLQPIETFYPEIADIWVENIRNIEIAELTCMNLFQHLPYAPVDILFSTSISAKTVSFLLILPFSTDPKCRKCPLSVFETLYTAKVISPAVRRPVSEA